MCMKCQPCQETPLDWRHGSAAAWAWWAMPNQNFGWVGHNDAFLIFFLLADSMVERCRTDDLMPNVHICCLPPRRVDPEVQGLKVIVDCPQPGSSRATYRPPAIAGGLSAASMTR